MLSGKIKKFIFSITIATCLLTAAHFAFAQTPLTSDTAFGGDTGQTAETLAGNAGLGTSDPREVVARVINVILGFLGIIAVALIIYAGFLWMTAQGNETQITTAKKIMTGAAIGLVIILAAFGIAAFVMRVLLGATGGGGASEPGTTGPGIPPGGELPAEFLLTNTSPHNGDKNVIRNVGVSYYFNSAVDGGSINDTTFKVEEYNKKDDAYVKVAGDKLTSGSRVDFTPTAVCPQPYNDKKCFSADTPIRVTAQNGAIKRSGDGRVLSCTTNVPCTIEFTVGTVIDTQPPTIKFNDVGQICAGGTVNLSATAQDDSYAKHVEFFADADKIGGDIVNNATPKTNSFTAQTAWNTGDLAAGTNVTLKAKAYDADTNTAEATKNITLRADHCCNLRKDADETGDDCGGADCAACPAAVCGNDVKQCAANNDACASGVCATNSANDKCVCQNVPIIDWISPVGGFCDGSKDTPCQSDADCSNFTTKICNKADPNGAVGNLVTIGGRFFGNTVGQVYFTCKSGSNCQNGIVAATLINNVNPTCGNGWSNNIIVTVVPESAITGPIGVVDAQKNYDRTDHKENSRGPLLPDFIVNNIKRPGLCKVDPATAEFDTNIILHGLNLGASGTKDNVQFGDTANAVSSTKVGNWNDKQISSIGVPNLQAGKTTVSVLQSKIKSNYLPLTINASSRAPFITKIEPVAGHAGDYVTIYGGNFGATKGEVMFGNAKANFNFPAECSQKEIWQNSQIIMKVPEKITNAIYKINVKVGGLEVEATKKPDFRVGNYCEKDLTRNCEQTDYDSANSNQIVCKRTCGASEPNCVSYDYGSCITTAKPGLCALTPDNGPIGTNVNFYGERFGSSPGTVKFYKDSNSVTPSIWEVNKDKFADKAIAAAPKEAISGPAKILNNAKIESNGLNFRVGSCLASGAAGAGNIACGTSQPYCCGAITQYAGSCMANADACGFVAGSTYAQYYFEFSTAPSTEIPCDGNITTPACEPNANLCPTDRPVCNLNCFCDPPAPPKVVESCDRDLENCSERLLPSPSPLTPLPTNWATGRKWTDDGINSACVNSVITARFDKLIDSNTLLVEGQGKTIIVRECKGSGGTNCSTEIKPSGAKRKEFIISNSNGQTAFIFTPEKLEQDTWYEVTLTTGIKSVPQAGGLPLASNYSWKFQTKSSSEPCGLSCLSVAPASYTASYKGERKEYIATPQQKDNACIILDGSAYTYNWDLKEVSTWSSSQPPQPTYALLQTKAEWVLPVSATNKNTVKAAEETKPNFPVHVIAQTKVGNDSYSGYGALNIKFGDFYVKEVFPVDKCTTVCTNAEVGAVFSAGIADSSLTGNVKLLRCQTDAGNKGNSCDINVDYDGTTITPVIASTADQKVKDKLSFGLGGKLLTANTWYEAVISGGTNGIKSGDGKTLVSTSTRQAINDYRWQFKTGQRACEADKITVTPEPAIATVVGQRIGHKAEASSNSQMCKAGVSQILRGNFYNWQWSSTHPTVADIKFFVKYADDKNASGQNVDTVGTGDIIQLNDQLCKLTANGFNADTKGQKTNIIAGINADDPSPAEQSKAVSGQNNFCLVCGHTNDAQCRIMDSGGILQDANATYGVGKNSCCYPRPYVQSAAPANDAVNVCRNALVSVEFNEPMEITSFNNNVLVVAKYDGACPENWPYLLLADASSGVPTTLSWLEHTIARITNAIARLPLVGQFFNASTALAIDYGSNWCVVPGTVGGYNFDGKGYASFAPQDLLKAGSDHLVLIKGDKDLTDGAHEGAKNIYGVSIGLPSGAHGIICRGNETGNDCKVNGESFYGQLIKFTALPDGENNNHGICAADKVELTPESHLFTTNQDKTGDDTIGEVEQKNDGIKKASGEDFPDSDKLFIAKSLSSSGQPIVSIDKVYSWQWGWSTDNDAVAKVRETSTDKTLSPNKAIIFTAATQRSSTFARAKLAIKDNVYNIGGSKEVGGEAQIWVMLCNNPWPAYQENWTPFHDSDKNCQATTVTPAPACHDTNFEFYYCRDKGSALFNDDLPAISDNGAILGEDTKRGVMKEFLFTRPEKPGAPVILKAIQGGQTEKGDFNDDKKVDAADVELLYNTIVVEIMKMMPGAYVLSEDSKIYDLDNSGYVDGDDVNLLFDLITKPTLILRQSPSGVDFYNIYQKSSNGEYQLLNKLESKDVYCDDSTCLAAININLENGKNYTFAVTAVKNTGIASGNIGQPYSQQEESALSNEVSITPKRTAGPAAPTNLSASVTNNAVVLTWIKSADSDVSNYKVYLGIDKDEKNEVRDAGNVNTYTWQNLDPKRTYYFKVAAVAGGLESEPAKITVNFPVAYWRLDEGGGTAIKDYSGNNINGIIKGNLKWEGDFLSFIGEKESYIIIPANNALNLSAGEFTQSAWIKLVDDKTKYENGKFYAIVGDDISESKNRYPSLYIYRHHSEANSLYAHAGFGDGIKWNNFIDDQENLWGATTWQQLSVTYSLKDGKKYKYYLNSEFVKVYQVNDANKPVNKTNLWIGRGANNFKGQIADVKIYNKALTPEQIKADYDSAKARFEK